MRSWVGVAVLGMAAGVAMAQGQGPAPAKDAAKAESFEVATVRPVEHDPKGGRFLTMQGTHRFIVRDYTLKMLIAAAYELNPREVEGGPEWMDAEYYNIEALTPVEKPTRDEQMAMLRGLLDERFQLKFHREAKEFSIFELEQAKGGAKIVAKGEPAPTAAASGPAGNPPEKIVPGMRPSTAAADAPSKLVSIVYPNRMLMPARNATMAQFAELLQRAILDRPVVDKTGLAGRFDFDLEWAPDETQFGGEVPAASADAPSAPLFTAVQEQLGLRLVATRGPVEALVVDRAEKPSAN